MQSSPPGGGPTVLRCPNCGAPIEAHPFASTTRCGYCHQTVVLAQPVAQRPVYPLPVAAAGHSVSSRTPLLIFVVAATVTASVAAFLALPSAVPPPPVAKAAAVAGPATPVAKPNQLAEPQAQAPAKTAEVKYPLGSLLRINPTVDIDGSQAHLAALFSTVTSERLGGDLSYRIPLDHPWFREAVLNWKNEKDGKLATVGFRPPLGDDRLKNQAEIRDCLAKGLGKPEAREVDHLAREYSYFWGRGFPKAWANLYSTYLWLAFEDPKGVAPVTFPTVVRTLAGCAGAKP
jgi:hypothetical protein